MRLSLRLAAALLWAAPAMAGVLNVPGTWPTIQQALDHAKPFDTILVQPGTYPEALVLPPKNLTLQSAGGAAVTIVDASGLSARPVTFGDGLPFSVTIAIQGFTLTGGSEQLGGGVYLSDSQSLALQDCVISGNTADFGGGVYALGEATLVNCQLVGNQASSSGGALYGPQLHLSDCLLSGNVAGVSGGGGYYGYYQHCSFEANVATQDGGGVAALSAGAQIVDCSFRGNVAGGQGGGAALSAFGTTFAVVGVAHCSFIDNQAHAGGGVSITGTTDGIAVIFSVSSCLFAGNAAVLGDGALTQSQASSTTCVRFCTFAGDGVQAAGALNVNHCIARDPPPGGPFVSTAGAPDVEWCDVQGGWPGLGNFDADPQFLDPLAPDLHLALTSPCVDAGDPAFVANGEGLGCGGPTLDMDGQPRIQHGRVDVGADESEPDCNGNGVGDLHDLAAGTSSDCDADGVPDECEPFADCNANGVRDACDIANGTSADCNGNGIPDECDGLPDCNGNGVPDGCDIATGASHDCNGNGVPDECDIALGSSSDADGDGWPDECETTLHVPSEFATIQAALDVAPDFATVLLAPGSYAGEGFVNLDFHGKVLQLVGDGGAEACVVDGGGLQAFVRLGAPEFAGVTLRGLTFLHGNAGSGGAVLCADGARLLADRCVFAACNAQKGGAICVRDGGQATLTRCILDGNTGIGGGGLRCTTATALLEHVSFEANKATGKGGSILADAGAQITVRDSILHGGNGLTGKEIGLLDDGTELLISFSDVAGGQAGVSGTGAQWGAGMLESAPLYVNGVIGDLHLLPGSPCINTADPSGAADPDGSPPDMGALAYEPWTVLGGGLAGSFGLPLLIVNGPLTADSPVSWSLQHGAAGAGFVLVVGFSPADLPFHGGVLWPMPDALLGLAFGHEGTAGGLGRWPAGVPSGTGVWLQAWLTDDGAIGGLAASDGVRGLAP